MRGPRTCLGWRESARTSGETVVRGLELDHDDVPLDEWVHRLAEALTRHAATNARAAALARVTDPSGSLG
ncbi:MAG: hypothetical protein M3P04_03300 [Actinomycetota bacterium]|nr:hypothetical protein [Actinomycetota bacterium]